MDKNFQSAKPKMSKEPGKTWEDYDTIPMNNGAQLNMTRTMGDLNMALEYLKRTWPEFAAVIANMRRIVTFEVDTMATDGYNCFINPWFSAACEIRELSLIFAHEAMHIILGHCLRGKESPYKDNHRKANIAADYEVNIILADSAVYKTYQQTFDILKNDILAYIDPKYAGKSFEEIYDMIPDPPQQSGGQGQGSNKYSDAYKKGWTDVMNKVKKMMDEGIALEDIDLDNL